MDPERMNPVVLLYCPHTICVNSQHQIDQWQSTLTNQYSSRKKAVNNEHDVSKAYSKPLRSNSEIDQTLCKTVQLLINTSFGVVLTPKANCTTLALGGRLIDEWN